MASGGLGAGGAHYHQPYSRGAFNPHYNDALPTQWSQSLSTAGPNGPAPARADGTFTNPNNPFEPFFGKAPKPITQSPYTRENLDLPDAYVGSNYYLSQVLITNITKQEQFWVTEVLPWQKSEDKDSLEWDELNFNDHMLNRRPEESTSRLLSFERTENRAAFVSYGIAMILESGFYKTQSGKMFYSLHLTQIMNATVETACMGAALALLNAKPPSTFFNERNDMGLDHDAFARTLSAEVDMFGVLHKTKYGLHTAHNQAKRILNQRGVNTPNYTILPEGAKACAAESLRDLGYLYTGKKDTAKPTADVSGMGRVQESRGFRIGEKRPNYDPFFQVRTFGNHFINSARITQNMSAEDYRTAYRDFFTFSIEKDDFHRHKLWDLYLGSGMVDNAKSTKFTRLGYNVMKAIDATAETWHDYLEDQRMLPQVVQSCSHHWNAFKRFATTVNGADENKVDQQAGAQYQVPVPEDEAERKMFHSAQDLLDKSWKQQFDAASSNKMGPWSQPMVNQMSIMRDVLAHKLCKESEDTMKKDVRNSSIFIQQWFAVVGIAVTNKTYRKAMKDALEGVMGVRTVDDFNKLKGVLGVSLAGKTTSACVEELKNEDKRNSLIKDLEKLIPIKNVQGIGNANDYEQEDKRADYVLSVLRQASWHKNAHFFLWCIDNNVPLALTFVLSAPHIRMECGTMLVMEAGASLGNTHYGWADFQLSSNANQKMIFGHFTIKLKALVRKSEGLVAIRDVYWRDYKGGGGHRYWQYTDDDRRKYRNGELKERDLFVMATDPTHTNMYDFMDTTGSFDESVYASEDGPEKHHATASIYAKFWGFRHGRDTLHKDYESSEAPRFNTITFQGTQVAYQPEAMGRGGFTLRTCNKGHLGDRQYPGCAKVYKGRDMHLLPLADNGTAAMAIVS